MSKIGLNEVLDQLQDGCNKLYDSDGATPSIISLQIAINRLRHTYNLHDKSEELNKEYVQ